MVVMPAAPTPDSPVDGQPMKRLPSRGTLDIDERGAEAGHGGRVMCRRSRLGSLSGRVPADRTPAAGWGPGPTGPLVVDHLGLFLGEHLDAVAPAVGRGHRSGAAGRLGGLVVAPPRALPAGCVSLVRRMEFSRCGFASTPRPARPGCHFAACSASAAPGDPCGKLLRLTADKAQSFGSRSVPAIGAAPETLWLVNQAAGSLVRASACRPKTCCWVETRSDRPRPRKLTVQCSRVVSRCLKPMM